MSAIIHDPRLDLDLAELGDDLFTPSKNGWLKLCQTKVDENQAEWLRTFAVGDISELHLPGDLLGSLYPRNSKRKWTVLFVANCSLTALNLKRGADAINYFRQAVLSWHKSTDLDFSESVNIPSTFSLQTTSLASLSTAFVNANPHLEVAPSLDLVSVFLENGDEWTGAKSYRAKFPLVDTLNKENVLICDFEVQKRINGSGLIYRDPTTMAFAIVDSTFLESVHSSATYIQTISGNWKKHDYRWRVREARRYGQGRIFDRPLEHPSVGLAAAMALEDAVRDKHLAGNYIFTGTVRNNGSIGPVANLEQKIDKSTDAHVIFVPLVQNPEEIVRNSSHRYRVKFAGSFYDVRDKTRSLHRTKRLTAGGIAALLLLVVIVISGYGFYLTTARATADERALAAEDRSEADRLAKVAADERAEADRQAKIASDGNASAAQQNELNALKERDLAGRERDLATQHSRILKAKNVELDIARNEEARQRSIAEEKKKEADRLKGIAEKNEETANAYQQVAQANQLAFQGLSYLNEKDYVSAETYLSTSLLYDDSNIVRSELLSAVLAKPINQRFNWSLEQRVIEGESAFEVGSENSFYRLDLDKTGEFFAYPLNEKEISLRGVKNGEEIEKISLNAKEFDAFSISPGGRYLAIGTADGDLVLRNNLTREETILFSIKDSTIPEDKRKFTALAFNSDGSYIAIATGKKEIVVLNLHEKQIINTFPEKGGNEQIDFDEGVIHLVFNASNGLAFSTIDDSLDAQIGYIPDVKGNAVLIEEADGFVSQISFLTDNQLITSGIGWKIWEVGNGKITQTSSENILSSPQTSAVSNQNFNFFLSAGGDGKLKLWDSQNRKLLTKISQNMGKPFRIALGDNGVMLLHSVTGDGKAMIFCWTLEKSKGSTLIASDVIDQKNPKMVSSNGLYVNFDCSKRLLEVTDFHRKETILSLQYDTSEKLKSLTLTPRLNDKGTHLLVKSEEMERINDSTRYTLKENLNLYDLSTREVTNIDISKYRVPGSESGTGNTGCWDSQKSTHLRSDAEEYLSADGKTVAILTKDNSIAIFSTNNLSIPISIISNEIKSNVNLPSGTYFETVFFLGADNQTLIRTAPTIQEVIQKNPFKAPSNYEARGYYNFEFYDIETGQLKQVIESPRSLSGYSLSPDGKFFAITDLAGYVYLWRLGSYLGLVDVVKTGNYDGALSPTFGSDSNLLAWTSTATGRIHFYDVANKKMLADWKTGELVGEINFVDKNKLSLVTYNGLHTFDFEHFGSLSLNNPKSTRDYIRSQSNIHLGFSGDGRHFDQSKLDTILGANKTELTVPSFVAPTGRPNGEWFAFDSDPIVKQSNKIDIRKGGFSCKPAFLRPIFNPYPLTFNSPAKECSNYPIIDIAPANGKTDYSRSDQEWESIRQPKTGELYYGLLYLSNGAANNLSSDEVDIRNVRLRIHFRKLPDGKYELDGILLADNVSRLSATIKLKTEINNRITVGSTVELYDYVGKRIKTIDISDTLETRGDNPDFEISLGDLAPGFATDLFIRFSFIVK